MGSQVLLITGKSLKVIMRVLLLTCLLAHSLNCKPFTAVRHDYGREATNVTTTRASTTTTASSATTVTTTITTKPSNTTTQVTSTTTTGSLATTVTKITT